jgi:hypothetical protein
VHSWAFVATVDSKVVLRELKILFEVLEEEEEEGQDPDVQEDELAEYEDDEECLDLI